MKKGKDTEYEKALKGLFSIRVQGSKGKTLRQMKEEAREDLTNDICQEMEELEAKFK